ncbi:MAG: copper chaperone PCu(A)C [Leptospirales bacterium]
MQIINYIKSGSVPITIIISFFAALVFTVNCGKPASDGESTNNSGFVFTDTWITKVSDTSEISAAYFKVENETESDDLFLGATSKVAEFIEIHEMLQDKDVTGMRMLDQVEVKANNSIQFTPGGLHLMLIGLTSPVKKGDSITLILNFKKAGPLKVNFTVKAPHEYYEED